MRAESWTSEYLLGSILIVDNSTGLFTHTLQITRSTNCDRFSTVGRIPSDLRAHFGISCSRSDDFDWPAYRR
jgi:hypothetical protein